MYLCFFITDLFVSLRARALSPSLSPSLSLSLSLYTLRTHSVHSLRSHRVRSLYSQVLRNTADFTWMFLKSMRVLGGPGMSTELTMLNFSEDESTRLVKGLKKRGVKPFAGFIYAAFHAYKGAVGAKPYCITQQASMQSRAYAPVENVEGKGDSISLAQFRKDRRYVSNQGYMSYYPPCTVCGKPLTGCLRRIAGVHVSGLSV